MSRLTRPFQRRMLQWLAKRQPASADVRLNQKILFVLPTGFGMANLGLALLFYILGTNYQNNLIMLLCYALLSLLLLSIMLAFFNLHGLTIHSPRQSAGFVGDTLWIPIEFSNQQQRRAIDLGFVAAESRQYSPKAAVMAPWQGPWPAQLIGQQLVPLPLTERGFFQLPRLKISTCFPFGLVRCWCYIALAQQYWAYPAPGARPKSSQVAVEKSDGEPEWLQLKSYQPGDALSKMDWKKLARQPLQPMVKQYSYQAAHSETWLEVSRSGPAKELEIAEVCAEILALSANNQPFGLKIGASLLAIGSGTEHQQQALQRLAVC